MVRVVFAGRGRVGGMYNEQKEVKRLWTLSRLLLLIPLYHRNRGEPSSQIIKSALDNFGRSTKRSSQCKIHSVMCYERWAVNGGKVLHGGNGGGVAWLHGAAPKMERRCRGMEIDTDAGLTRSALTIGADALYIPITYMHTGEKKWRRRHVCGAGGKILSRGKLKSI